MGNKQSYIKQLNIDVLLYLNDKKDDEAKSSCLKLIELGDYHVYGELGFIYYNKIFYNVRKNNKNIKEEEENENEKKKYEENKAEAIKYLEKFTKYSLTIFCPSDDDKKRYIHALSVLSVLYHISDPKKSEMYEYECVNYLSDYNILYTQMFNVVGNMYFNKNNIEKAIYYYKISTKKHYYESYIKIGSIYFSLGDYNKALKYFNLYLEFESEKGIKRTMVYLQPIPEIILRLPSIIDNMDDSLLNVQRLLNLFKNVCRHEKDFVTKDDIQYKMGIKIKKICEEDKIKMSVYKNKNKDENKKDENKVKAIVPEENN